MWSASSVRIWTLRISRSLFSVSVLSLSLAGCTCENPADYGAIERGRPMERAAAALKHWNQTKEVEPGLQALLDDASGPDAQRRGAAALHLPHAKDIPERVIDWVAGAKSGWALLATLGAIGPQAKQELPSVRAAMDDKDLAIRLTAAWALFRITGAVDEPVRRLMKELIAAPVGARPSIADALLEIGKSQRDRCAAVLTELQKDPAYAQAAKELLALMPH